MFNQARQGIKDLIKQNPTACTTKTVSDNPWATSTPLSFTGRISRNRKPAILLQENPVGLSNIGDLYLLVDYTVTGLVQGMIINNKYKLGPIEPLSLDSKIIGYQSNLTEGII